MEKINAKFYAVLNEEKYEVRGIPNDALYTLGFDFDEFRWKEPSELSERELFVLAVNYMNSIPQDSQVITDTINYEISVQKSKIIVLPGMSDPNMPRSKYSIKLNMRAQKLALYYGRELIIEDIVAFNAYMEYAAANAAGFGTKKLTNQREFHEGDVVYHFKRGDEAAVKEHGLNNYLYQILAPNAKNTETGETLVVYRALYGDNDVWVRPKELFLSEVDHDKYPDCKNQYRFTKALLDEEKGK